MYSDSELPAAGLALRSLAALVTAFCGFCLGLAAAVYLEAPRIWQTALLVSAVSGAAVWAWLLLGWIRDLYPQAPQPVYYDEPAQEAPPAPASETVRVEIWDQPEQKVDFLSVDIPAARLRRVGHLAARDGFSHAALAGPGKPLSRAEYESLRNEFLSRGFATWNNPQAPQRGVRLLASGRAVMRRLAEAAE